MKHTAKHVGDNNYEISDANGIVVAVYRNDKNLYIGEKRFSMVDDLQLAMEIVGRLA